MSGRWRPKVFLSRPWWARPPKRAVKSLVWAYINRKAK